MPSNCLRCGSSDVWVTRKVQILNDGVKLSIQVGESLYCHPRDNNGSYDAVEIGFITNPDGTPHTPPEYFAEYADGSFPSDVYGYVPVAILERFIAEHGGRKNFI